MRISPFTGAVCLKTELEQFNLPTFLILEDLYCANWQSHTSPYALQHYAQHLFVAEKWCKLFALASDNRYSAEQHKAFPEEPDLFLQTIAWAIKAAIQLDNPVKMGEFILRQATRVTWEQTQATPLSVLRAGSSERAIRLAELYDFEDRVLWLLLLVWELQDMDKQEEAREALNLLRSMKLDRFHGWSGGCIAYLLLPVLELSNEAFSDLGQRLLWDEDSLDSETMQGIRQASEILVQRGYYQAAIEPFLEWPNVREQVFCDIARQMAALGDEEGARKEVSKIRRPATAAQAIALIAVQKAKAGRLDAAQEDLKSALCLARDSGKAYAIAEVAVQQAQVGLFEEALHTLEQISLSLLLIETLTRIAICQHQQGGDSEQLLRQASQTVHEKLESKYRSKGLSSVAVAYAQTGLTTVAQSMFEQLIDEAVKKHSAQEDLSALAQAQADAGFFEAALQTVSKIENNGWKSNAIKHILERRAKAVEFTETLEIARSTSRDLSIFVSIAAELVRRGQSKEARNVFAEILGVDSRHKLTRLDTDSKNRALIYIAAAEAQNGRFEDARSVVQWLAPDTYLWHKALERIAVEQVHFNELASAKITLEELKHISSYDCDQAAAQIVVYLSDKDKLVEAREFRQYVGYGINRVEADAAIAVAEARTGNVVGALKLARDLGDLAPRAIGKIAEISFCSGHTDDFREANLTFWHQETVVRTNTWIAYAYIKAGHVLAANEMLNKALLDSRHIEGTVEYQKALIDIAVVQRCADRIQDAENTLVRALNESTLRSSSEIITPLRKDDLRERMVKILVEVGENVAAFEQAMQIANIFKQATALSIVACEFPPKGFAEAVLQIANMIQIRRHDWILKMAEALVKAGEKESFKNLLISSAGNLDSAYRMCGLLTELYPNHTKDLLQIVQTDHRYPLE